MPDDDEPRFLIDAARAVAQHPPVDSPDPAVQADDYVVRHGAAYFAHDWDASPPPGSYRPVTVGPVRVEAPSTGGPPGLAADGVTWTLDDAEVLLTVAGGLHTAPTAEAWIDVRASVPRHLRPRLPRRHPRPPRPRARPRLLQPLDQPLKVDGPGSPKGWSRSRTAVRKPASMARRWKA